MRQGDLERVAVSLTGSVAEVSGVRVPALASGQGRVDAAVAAFAGAWSSGLSALVDEVGWCAGQLRACAVAYADADAGATGLLRRAAE